MKYILLISLICITAVMFAAPVSREQAIQAATNWTNHWAPQDFVTRSIEKVIPIGDNVDTQLYLFQYANGFVLTSADDSAIPIVAYGYNTVVNETQDNASFKAFLNSKQQEMQQINSQRADNSVTSAKWRILLANQFDRTDTRNLNPLVQTRWNQGWPYNMYCPVDAAGSGGHVYAGCVATAMSQVMKYWNWPNTGVGSHSYYAYGYGNQSANFGQTTYNWTAMPNSVGGANEEVGRLLYQLGISVDMGYSPTGSGAQSYDAVDALETHFRYNAGIQLNSKYQYSEEAWDAMLTAELDNARPLYYHGFGDGGGHAFVCDGYQGTDYFHFNWGWSGSYDGYFLTDNLNPGYEFNDGQGAMFNVYPLNYNMSMVKLSLQGNNCSVGEQTPIAINSLPIMPQWNVNNISFVIDYDASNMVYTGYESTQTMLDGGTITSNIIEPGRIAITGSCTNALSGAGTLLKVIFQPMMPGNYPFSMSDFSFNSTPVTLVSMTDIDVTADVMEPQNSVIDLMNAMHVPYNEIAEVPITTTFVMPGWNVQNISFIIHYPTDKVSWEGYNATDCLAEGAIITLNNSVPGAVSINISYEQVLYGSGNLIKLKFRATGNSSAVTLVTITPSDFYYGTNLVQNLSPGYIVLSPYTANDDETAAIVQNLTISPNPFKDTAKFKLEIAGQNQQTVIGIYNLKGQLVRKLYNANLKSNKLDLNWDGKDDLRHNAQSGLYLVKVQAGNFHKTLKLLKL